MAAKKSLGSNSSRGGVFVGEGLAGGEGAGGEGVTGEDVPQIE
jgi:hypothetical protein